jgi:hypothetical protein
MDETLADLLNKEVLMELAGERAFDRGADYFADRQVVGCIAAQETALPLHSNSRDSVARKRSSSDIHRSFKASLHVLLCTQKFFSP